MGWADWGAVSQAVERFVVRAAVVGRTGRASGGLAAVAVPDGLPPALLDLHLLVGLGVGYVK